MTRVLLVGESNPYGNDPRYALYPGPANSAGGRLCLRILGLEPREYLRRFERMNLCQSVWNRASSVLRAAEVDAGALEWNGHFDVIVLLGSKVAESFRLARDAPAGSFAAFSVANRRRTGQYQDGSRYVVLPHPSGRCLVWNYPESIPRARALLAEHGALTPQEGGA